MGTAPRIEHSKHKVKWTKDGILEYKKLLENTLPSLQTDYCDFTEPEMVSVLFQLTHHMLTSAAMNTNKCVVLGKAPKVKKPSIPPPVKAAIKAKDDALKLFNNVDNDPSANDIAKQDAKLQLRAAKSLHQK